MKKIGSCRVALDDVWSLLMPCAGNSEALHFQIPNSLRKVSCVERVVCKVGGSRLLQNVCNISPFDTSPYSRRHDLWARILVGCWTQVNIISLVHCRTVAVTKRNVTGCTGCPTRYRTPKFVNNFTTNEDIANEIWSGLTSLCKKMWKKRTYCCSNFVAISLLVLELLKKCRVR